MAKKKEENKDEVEEKSVVPEVKEEVKKGKTFGDPIISLSSW